MNAVTQEDIGMFQDMFSKLSNILVKASDLGAKIPELEAQLAALSVDAESVRKKNMELDEQLAIVRSQRDEAQGRANTLESLCEDRLRQVQNITSLHDLEVTRNASLVDALAIAQKDRDDYGYKNMELSDQLERANARIKQVNEFMANAMSVIRPDEPNPAPVVLPLLEQPVNEVQGLPHSEPVSPPVMPTTKRVYRYGEEGANYTHEVYVNNRDRHWDELTHDYYVEVAA